jgi:hypothetical protein
LKPVDFAVHCVRLGASKTLKNEPHNMTSISRPGPIAEDELRTKPATPKDLRVYGAIASNYFASTSHGRQHEKGTPKNDPAHARALEQLHFAMRRALVERRQVIDIGEFRVRFQRRDEVFEDGDDAFQALQSGIFVYFPGESGGKPVKGRWLHHGSSDDLEAILHPYLQGMKAPELEALRVTIAANAALQSMSQERAAARHASRDRVSSGPVGLRPGLFQPSATPSGEFVTGQYQQAHAQVESEGNRAGDEHHAVAPRRPRMR